MDSEEFTTETHTLWATDNSLVAPVESQVDEMLLGFLCYPDFEWAKYGIRPPENHDLVGSWRNTNGEAFVFLLRKIKRIQTDREEYLIIIVGLSSLVGEITDLVYSHKGNLVSVEKKELKRKAIDENLKEESKNKSIENFSKLIGVFTILVNAFSLYLRDLPPPTNMHPATQSIYFFSLSILHISASALLLIIVCIAILYAVRYGYMMLRRMR